MEQLMKMLNSIIVTTRSKRATADSLLQLRTQNSKLRTRRKR
jgi:hypothetical protein